MPHLPTEVYDFAQGVFGTPAGERQIRSGGLSGPGRTIQIATAGELQFLLRRGDTVIGTWIHPASDPPETFTVPAQCILSARRPAASAGLAGTVQLVVNETTTLDELAPAILSIAGEAPADAGQEV